MGQSYERRVRFTATWALAGGGTALVRYAIPEYRKVCKPDTTGYNSCRWCVCTYMKRARSEKKKGTLRKKKRVNMTMVR